jgi:HK97 family phage major capsid protein
MPWDKFEQEGQICIFKVDADGNRTGDTLGCHDTEAEADAHLAALHANEPEAKAAEPEAELEPEPEATPEPEPEAKSLEAGETVVTFGGAVKALGNGRLGGYLVRFTGADEPDLEGEFFDKDTDFGPHRTSLVYYQHGADGKLRKRVLDDDAEIGTDDIGVWIQAQLELRDEYEQFIYHQAEKGKMGWSSGTAAHLVEKRRQEGKATRITRWPLGLDASITPTPAEPRNAVMPLKSLDLAELELPAEEPPEAPEKGAAVKAVEPATPTDTEPSSTSQEQITMTEQVNTVEERVATPAPDISEAVKAALTQVLAEMPAFQKALVQAPEGKDHPETKSFGDYLVAIQRGDGQRLEKVYKSTKTMSETTGEAGGYLVPAEYSNEILRLASERSIIRPRARFVNATTREMNYPVLKTTGTTANQPHALGGVVASWTEEGGEKTETTPALATVKLVYHELSGYTIASNMLRQDAGATLESLLRGLFADAIAWYEDWAFLRGDGAGKPRGILNSNCLVTVATGDSLTLAHLASMMAVHLSNPGEAGPSPSAVWIMHRAAVEDLVQLNDLYNVVWIQTAREVLPVSLFGKPIIFSEKMPAKAGSGSDPTYCLLADLNYYIVYGRQQLQIDFSEHYRFVNNEGTWRFVSLVDGQPWLQSAFTEADGSTEVSPFVCSKNS